MHVNAALRQMRIIFVMFIASAAMFIWIAERLYPRTAPELEPLLYTLLLLVSIGEAVGVILMRFRMVGRSEARLTGVEPDYQALQTWRSGHIVMFALSESVLIFGLVVRFIGGTLGQALIFYIISGALFLYSFPRRPEAG